MRDLPILQREGAVSKSLIGTLNTIVHFTPTVVVALAVFEAIILAVFGQPNTTWDVVKHLIAFEVVSGLYLVALIATLKPVETGGTTRIFTKDDLLTIVGFSVLFVATIVAAITCSSFYPPNNSIIRGIAVSVLIVFLTFGYFIARDER